MKYGRFLPSDGWICTSLGVRQAAPRLTLQTKMSGTSVSLLTVMTNGPSRMIEVHEAGGVVGIMGESWVDWVAAADITAGTAMATDGRLAVCRTTDAGVVEQAYAQGTSLRVDELELNRLYRLLKPVAAR